MTRIETGAIITVVLAVIGFAFWLGGVSNTVSTLEASIAALDPAAIAEARTEATRVITEAAGGVQTPVGAVLPYHGGEEFLKGTGWVLCDGERVDDRLLTRYELDSEDISPRFLNVELPDLKDRFVKGLAQRALLAS